jgi:RNA polymerase sigma factor FliA
MISREKGFTNLIRCEAKLHASASNASSRQGILAMANQAMVPGSPTQQQIEGSRARRADCARRRSQQRGRPDSNRADSVPRDPRQGPHHDCDALVVQLLPLVRRVAFQMRERLPAHVEVDDLVSAGTLGLLDAVRKFDPGKHVKLESYAQHRIRGAILDGLRELDTASRDMRKKNKKAEKLHRDLETRLGRPVRSEDMAAELGISLRKWYRTVVELQPLGVEWLHPMEAAEIRQPDEESLVSPDAETAFDRCYRREKEQILRQAMACLAERDRQMMALYYGRELTMKEIGEGLGIDESRVSQLHSAALLRLRSFVRTLLSRPRTELPPAYVVAGLESSRAGADQSVSR